MHVPVFLGIVNLDTHRKLRKKLCHANIKIRSNFVLSKKRSWVIVDTHNFFGGGH